jgi:hypothetical protein
MRAGRATIRKGLTLTEVVFSLAIFLFSFAAIGQLISVSSQRALEGQFKQQGVFLCQSKLVELSRGIEPLQSTSGAAFAHDSTWTWSAACEPMNATEPPLWRVEVSVQRSRPDGTPLVVTMTKLVLDPAYRGSTLDPAPLPAAEETGEGAGENQNSSNSSNSGNTATTPKQ